MMPDTPKPKWKGRSLAELAAAQTSNSLTPLAPSLSQPKQQNLLSHSSVATDGTRPTKGTNVLSWDCGLTNLCYCWIEYIGEPGREFNVILWENFSLNATTLKHAVSALVKELNRRPWMMTVDHVCIESQVIRNTQMKVISHVLQAYFATRSTHVLSPRNWDNKTPPPSQSMLQSINFIAPKSKFSVCKVVEPKLKSRRARNKKVAVLMAIKLLEDNNHPLTLEFFKSKNKQDDLADSFVQGLYFLRYLEVCKQINSNIKTHIHGSRNAVSGGTVIDLNEGCEINDEMPLPQVYKSDHFTGDVYSSAVGPEVPGFNKLPMSAKFGMPPPQVKKQEDPS